MVIRILTALGLIVHVHVAVAQMALDSPYINERFLLNSSASILYEQGVPSEMERHSEQLRIYALDEPYYWLNRVYFRVRLDENEALTESALADSIVPLVDIINLGLDSDLVLYGNMGYTAPCDPADRRSIEASTFILKVDFSYDYTEHRIKSSITGISFEQPDGRLVHLYFPELRWWLKNYKVRTHEGLIGCDAYFDRWLLTAHRIEYAYATPENGCGNCRPYLEEQGELDALTNLWLLEHEMERAHVMRKGEQTFPVPSFGGEHTIGTVRFEPNGQIKKMEVYDADRTILIMPYKEGKPHGSYTRHLQLPYGKEQGHFSDGLRTGTWTSWFANDTIRSVRQYAHGLLQGPQLVNHPNGQTYLKYDMENGDYQGSHESYYSDGSPRAHGQMENGFTTGTWTYNVRIDSVLRAYLDEHLVSFPASAWQDNTISYTVKFWVEPSRPDCMLKRCQRWEIGETVE